MIFCIFSVYLHAEEIHKNCWLLINFLAVLKNLI
nr:MAG TPA: hypothetical protein [Caudoviricetes sp.]